MKSDEQDDESNCNKAVRQVDFIGGAEKELKDVYGSLPPKRAKQIATCLSYLADGQKPTLAIGHLSLSKGLVAMELKLQGSPAYRVVFTTKYPGKLYVLYAGKKTAQGTDRQLIKTVEQRLGTIG